jgi:hypothetical protein
MLSRLKFEIAPLVNEVLDMLPEDVWTSDSTTFLDPAMGGGQFLVEIERRLKNAGHSNQNIAKRVFGCEKNKLRVNYAKNNKKLVSENLQISDFISYDWGNMKFDVVVGNPPYQNTHGAKRWPIWHEFVAKSAELSNEHVLLVTPNSWIGAGKGEVKDTIWKSITKCSLDVDKYFNVGSTFSWFSLDVKNHSSSFEVKTPQGVFSVDKTTEWLPAKITTQALGINNKVFSQPSFSFKRGECHTSNKEKFSDKGYEVFHTHAQTLYVKEEPANYKSTKVAFTLSGDIRAKIGKNFGTSQAVAYLEIPYKQKSTAEFVFNSQLFRWLLQNNKWSGWNSLDVIKRLPQVDLSVSWDDQKLFDHFQLTPDEISEIVIQNQ